MLLQGLNTLQIIFLILTPIVLVVLVVLFIVIPLNHKRQKNNFKEYCYKAIYRIAFDEDYYLINNFLFKIDSTKVARIDHVLFGNKYIYLIIDIYYEGDLMGKEEDESLIHIDQRNKKQYTLNQYAVVKSLIKALSSSTGMSEDLFIGIAVVNNSCKLGIETKSKQCYMIQRKNLKKLVKAIESREVGKINAAQLDAAVKSFDEQNRAKKK